MEKLGIKTDFISVSKKETGKCIVKLDNNNIPSYDLLEPVAYDYIKAPDVKGHNFDVLYFGTLACRHKNNRNVLKKLLDGNSFGNVFVDMNIRSPFYSEDVIRFACQKATILKISDEELPIVMDMLGKTQTTDKICAEVLSAEFTSLKLLIITKGEQGSFVYSCLNKKFYECEAEKVEVISTVGAGDSFSAAFLTKYFKTKDIAISLSLASKISAFVVSCKDAIPDYNLSDFE